MENVFDVLLQTAHKKKGGFFFLTMEDFVKVSSVSHLFRGLFFSHSCFPLIVYHCLCKKYDLGKGFHFHLGKKNVKYEWDEEICAVWLFGLNSIVKNRMIAVACQEMWSCRSLPPKTTKLACDFRLCDFLQMYRNLIGFNLSKAHELAAQVQKRKRASSAVVLSEYAFTFHIVIQKKQCSSTPKQTEQRRFVCFHSAQDAMNFFLNWCNVQYQCILNNVLKEITTLYECGFTTMDPKEQEGMERKWVFDIDAPFEKLYMQKLIQAAKEVTLEEIEVLNRCVVSFGKHLSDFLLRNNLVSSLPFFCILTRHTNKKLSWHITVNVMGKMKHWGVLLHHFEQEVEQHQSADFYNIVCFVDKCTRNNKKGQYMQTLNSMKTSGIEQGGMFPFLYYGFFNGLGTKQRFFDSECEEDLKRVWHYMTCSLMIFDPWCVRMNTHLLDMVCLKVDSAMLQGKRKRAMEVEVLASHDTSSSSKSRKEILDGCSAMTSVLSSHRTEHELSSFNCIKCTKTKEWVKGFVFSANFKTSFLPSMRESRNICSMVMALKNEKRCKVLVHSYISGCGVCPRIFKVLGKDYQHGSNSHCVVICIKMTNDLNSYRAFAYCMSGKCKHIVNARHGPGWIEYTREDYLKLKCERGKS